jgi:hypothetical protein
MDRYLTCQELSLLLKRCGLLAASFLVVVGRHVRAETDDRQSFPILRFVASPLFRNSPLQKQAPWERRTARWTDIPPADYSFGTMIDPRAV